MRILHVCPGMVPFDGSDRARYVWSLAKQQATLHNAAIFSAVEDRGSPTGRVVIERREGLTICWVNTVNSAESGTDDAGTNELVDSSFARFLHEMRSDVVHFHGLDKLSAGIIEIATSKDIRTVFTPHTAWETCSIGTRRCRTDGSLCHRVETSKCGPCVYGSAWADVLRNDEHERLARKSERSRDAVYQSLYTARFDQTPGWFARRPRAKAFALRKLGTEMRRLSRLQGPDSSGDPIARRLQVLQTQLKRIDLITAPSGAMHQDLIATLGITPDRVVPRPLASPGNRAVARPATSGVRRLGYWGSIDGDPGLRSLVTACCDLLAGGTPLQLCLFGTNAAAEASDWVTAKFAECGHPSRVELTRVRPETNVADALQDIDVVIEPKLVLGAPSEAVRHAAESGTPLLVARFSSFTDFARDHGYGATYDGAQPGSLERELLALMESSSSDLGATERAPCRFRSMHHEAHDYVRIYHELLYKTLSVEAESESGFAVDISR